MDYRDYLNNLLNKAKENMEDVEAFLIKDKEISMGVYKGQLDKYSIAESGGLSLRGIYNGKMGYSYTERIDDSSVDKLIQDTLENSKYIDDLDPETIFEGSDKYENINNFNETLGNVPVSEKIDFLKKLEKEALSLDNRVFAADACVYQEFEQERYIRNTKGIDLHDKVNGAISYISVVVKDGEDTKTGFSLRIIKNFSELDHKQMAKEAVENAISMLGAKSIKSDKYPVVFENKTFADLLSAFSSVFSADNVQKGLSGLKDKIGEEIGSPILNIVDDPFLKDGFGSRNFDDEGTKTSFKKLIDNGKLTSYLYNWKTANKEGVQSTGNASRSYKGQISISPTNLYIEKGDKSFEELVNSISKGLYINNLEGLHSGLNPVSGDFSLSASGYGIEDGKISRAVNLITIAGNLYELLKDIEAIGNDLEFGIYGYIGSPSIKVKSLSISGE
ncbi:TldD/PmbA family protein [Wansuia hejianensis]|uniref:TldD/PmbA family protein n=1 Tax=Wansuia hejianensis TaxID=2763667 RepID=A0A926F3Q7_9FIRM|nr:TldD/PmbA family protein [Wansuia hejianensis]MBC8591334.1 TldD/PmbA family protein [Wansuia hejianensis]